jgi:hypothetical protein
MSAAARSLEVLSAPPTLPWEEWAVQAHADYEANLEPQALAGMPAESPRGPVDMAEVVALLQKHLPPDAAITNGAGNFASWVHRYFRYHGLAKGHKTQLGLRRAGGHRGQPGNGSRGLHHCRRRRFSDDRARARDGFAARRQEHHRAAEQRHVRHHPHAPGA